MNKITVINNLTIKINESENSLTELLNNETLSKNTKQTQKFSRTKDIRLMKLLLSVVDMLDDEEIDFSEDEENWFESLTTLTSDRKKSIIDVNENDDLIELLQKYKDVKDVYNKIMKCSESKNLVLENNKFVRK